MSDLVGNPEDRFSQIAAHIISVTVVCIGLYRKHPSFSCYMVPFRQFGNISNTNLCSNF